MKGTSFGAPTEYETDMAERIVKMFPSIDMVRMVNSGTEATMSAIRLARGYTGKDLILKFAGNYHGHGDSFLIKAGSGAITLGLPDSPGVTKGNAQDTILADYNDLESVEKMFSERKGVPLHRLIILMYQNETISNHLPLHSSIYFAESPNRQHRNEHRRLLFYSRFYFERTEFDH